MMTRADHVLRIFRAFCFFDKSGRTGAENSLQPHPEFLQPIRFADHLKSFRCGISGNTAVAAGEHYRDVREFFPHGLGEFEAIQPAGHDNVCKDEIDLHPPSQQGERCSRLVHDLNIELPLPEKLTRSARVGWSSTIRTAPVPRYPPSASNKAGDVAGAFAAGKYI